MFRRQPLAALLPALALVVLIAPSTPRGPTPTTAASTPSFATDSSRPAAPLHPYLYDIWQAADGPVASGEADHSWLWGPAPLAVTTEGYSSSPTGTRTLAYFDKGRLDVNDPSARADSIWFAPGGQLVTELLAGALQLGDDRWVRRDPARIPVAGDPHQPHAVTYATLGAVATLPHALRGPGYVDPGADSRVGGEVTAVLGPDGSIDGAGQPSAGVYLVDWDPTTRHNIAAPFKVWGESQVYPWLYVLGHPLTEPLWVDAVVGGAPRRVLVQAFERRLLSYTPDNAREWQTEAGNVGRHYRAWRGLAAPDDPTLAPLAAWEPFGEELVAAAKGHGVDPYLLAAIAEVASNGDPFARQSNGGQGLLGLRAASTPRVHDPGASATLAAGELAALAAATRDERALLASYYAGSGGDPSAPAAQAFADAVIAARDALHARQVIPATTPTPQPLPALGTTSAAVYPDAGGEWWPSVLAWYASWGGAPDGWTPDPHGYYCAYPGYAAGDRLRLVANGVAIDCTVGARAGDPNVPAPIDTPLALSRAAFDALGLGDSNSVVVFHAGPANGAATRATWIDAGGAAFYAASYDRTWWERTLQYHAGYGNAVPGWSLDPNGYYCVYPSLAPGTRLRLVANGRTLDCTIGDVVAAKHVAQWQARWAVELSWDTFVALGLDGNNVVEVYQLE